jgi:hypothetical protein
MTRSCLKSDFLQLNHESQQGRWVTRPWTLGCSHFQLSPSLILLNLYLVGKSSANGFGRFHANLVCYKMCT